ncbi:MAG TPA: alternative ribosome rescue aminoacyl-tRNA hydrolase ArfB [Planctomycetota bacterium]|jgi:ribosome-associated protein|nr:alternative ribosome rescue aminoacyl-tRNA hydrolase ArfB [Planctomycetota bacterium]
MASRLPSFLEVTGRVRIPAAEIDLSYASSSGPGGQNVNKVASKAVLRWNPGRSVALSPEDRAFALERLAPRLTNDGDLVLSSDRNRDQPRNVEDVLERLRDLLRAALLRPRRRKATRPTRAARERRLHAKKARSETKRGRRAAE